MRSYRPQERFGADGALVRELAALAPDGELRMGTLPEANGGSVLADLVVPDPAAYALAVPQPATTRAESTRQLGARLSPHAAHTRSKISRGTASSASLSSAP